MKQLQRLFGGVVGLVASIEQAPINLNALLMKHPFVTLPELTQRVTKHYQQQVLGALGSVLGSAEFLGSPVSLVSNIGTGVKGTHCRHTP